LVETGDDDGHHGEIGNKYGIDDLREPGPVETGHRDHVEPDPPDDDYEDDVPSGVYLSTLSCPVLLTILIASLMSACSC